MCVFFFFVAAGLWSLLCNATLLYSNKVNVSVCVYRSIHTSWILFFFFVPLPELFFPHVVSIPALITHLFTDSLVMGAQTDSGPPATWSNPGLILCGRNVNRDKQCCPHAGENVVCGN